MRILCPNCGRVAGSLPAKRPLVPHSPSGPVVGAWPNRSNRSPWGFSAVSPSHLSIFLHHGMQRITVEISEDSPLSLV